jgi:hypothetical protein
MEIKWRKLNFECVACKRSLTILFVSASADGELRFDVVCPPCGLKSYIITTSTKLIAQAIYLDLSEAIAAKNPKKRFNVPLRPPLADSLEKHTDDAFLKDLGIDPDGEDK